jgi:three-Cys-motif partner protein
MTARHDTTWPIEPHTLAKHEILRRYLEAWFPILSKHHKRVVYIDGFCGPGRYADGRPGSPLIALDVAAKHKRILKGEIVFWFIDEKRARIDHLKQELVLCSLPSRFSVHPKRGDFREVVDEILQPEEAPLASADPTFAFLDPFGVKGIPFSIVRRVLSRKHCEVLITFMVDAVNRFLEHPDEGVAQHIIDLFGTDECIRIAQTATDRIVGLRMLYQNQLATIAKFVRFFEMKDRRDRTIYFLFFASNHRKGHVKMKEAMWKVDPEGDFRFSDATDPGQMVLFSAEVPTTLDQQMEREFAGKGIVQVGQIREFVEDHTAYLKKHMKAVLKLQESEGKIHIQKTKTDGDKRRKGTFPDAVEIEYA